MESAALRRQNSNRNWVEIVVVSLLHVEMKTGEKCARFLYGMLLFMLLDPSFCLCSVLDWVPSDCHPAGLNSQKENDVPTNGKI